MKERGVGKPWTKDEDNLLIQAVHVHGENDNWKTIALYVPGRTNKACRKRWLHSLSPYVKKTAWTQEEDHILLSLYAKHGTKWSTIAREIPGRTDDACSKRYREALDPSLKRSEWTSNEDRILLEVYGRIGGKWGQVGHELNRSGLACRNRWRMLERKKAQNNNRDNRPLVLDTQYPAEPADITSTVTSPWELSVPYVESAYWGTDSQSYTSPEGLMQDDVADQFESLPSAAYLSPVYSPPTGSPEYHEPAPFRFSSSSLSDALRLSMVSPSSSQAATRPFEALPTKHAHHVNTDQTSGSSPTNSESSQQTVAQDPGYPSLSSSSSSSPNLSAIGSQDLTLPVPFDNARHDSCPIDESNVPEAPEPCLELPCYPTPGPSPIANESLQIPTDQDRPSEEDPPRHYRTAAEKKTAVSSKTVSKKSPRHNLKGGPPRLSASLPASDNVLAYVCGHETCWPSGQSASRKCYGTSQELYDHWKVEHNDDATCERPYRCGLPGCGKGWKSINGLQYHLQLSKAHFQKAITASITQLPDAATVDTNITSAGVKKRLFACTHPGCVNQYKQMSGLRYHLAHGHSQQLPHQLNLVPPALARKVADKLHPHPLQETSSINLSAQPGQ